jgi:hypothetical protein
MSISFFSFACLFVCLVGMDIESDVDVDVNIKGLCFYWKWLGEGREGKYSIIKGNRAVSNEWNGTE